MLLQTRLKRKDIPSSRSIYQLAVSERHIKGSGYGSLHPEILPTPDCSDRRSQKSRQWGLTNYMKANLLPTPQAWDGKRGGQLVEGNTKTRITGQTYSSNLNDLARSNLLPAPLATDIYHKERVKELKKKNVSFHSRINGEIRPNGLMNYLYFNNIIPPKNIEKGKRKECLKNHSSQPKSGQISRLSPLFVEEMMGYPLTYLLLPFLSRNGDRKP